MKNNKLCLGVACVMLAASFVLIVADLAGAFSGEQNVVKLLNNGLKQLEHENISVDNLNDGKHSMDSALCHFGKAYEILPNHEYTRFCYSLANYCVSNYEMIDSILGLEWISAECSFLQSLVAMKKESVDDLVCVITNFIINRPDAIESLFVADLSEYDSVAVQKSILASCRQLKRQWSDSQDPIIGAKLAKILLSIGDCQQAKRIFEQVVTLMPNMNRPWFYLACIAYNEGDDSLAYSYLNRSEFFDGNDPLPKILRAVLLGQARPQKMHWQFSSHLRLVQAYDSRMPRNAIIIDGLNEYLHPCDSFVIKTYINRK